MTRYRRGEAAIAVFATWMLIGLFLDGWAHNANKPETFFSPWHGILYSGFVAAVAFFAWDGRRREADGESPEPGDRLTTVGLVLFIVGAVGDGVWHEVFGVEVDLEALLSPTHLLLLIGGFLMVTTSVRATWSDPSVRKPPWREFLPTLVALTLTTALVLFFTQYLSAFEGVAYDPIDGRDRELREVEGLASILATNLILLAPVVYTLRRLHPPPGSFALLFTAVAVGMVGLHAFELVELALPALLAGFVADLLVAQRRPVALMAAVTPVVLWSAYFLVADFSYGLGWTVELWAGAIVLTGASGVLLAALTAQHHRGADDDREQQPHTEQPELAQGGGAHRGGTPPG